MRLSVFLTAAALLLPASLVARADVLYTVTIVANGSDYDGTYSFEEPSIQTTHFQVESVNFLSSSGAAMDDIFINPVAQYCSAANSGLPSCLEADNVAGGDPLVEGFSEDLTSLGTYTSQYSDVTLTIADVSAVTPEPSSLLLLGTGLLGMVGVMKRRWRKA